MNVDLHQLLHDVVPEPTRSLDAGAVLSAARRRQRRGRATAAALVAVAVGVVVPLASLARGGGRDTGPVAVSAAALADRAPLGEMARGTLAGFGPFAHPGEGTLVGVVGDDEVWLVEQATGGLCLLLVYEKYGSAGVGCQPRSDLVTKGIVFGTAGVRPHAPLLLIVAVPDGYQTVRAGAGSAQVQRGVAVLAFDFSRRPAGNVTASGPGKPRLSFPLDRYVLAPGSARAPATDALAGEQARKHRLLFELVRRADAYQHAHGSTKGFVASLSDSQRRAAHDLQALSDKEATARVGGQCQDADLRTSTVYAAAPC